MRFSETFIDDEVKALAVGLSCIIHGVSGMRCPPGNNNHLGLCPACVFYRTGADGRMFCDTSRIASEAQELILMQSNVISKIRAILDNWEDIGYGMPIETGDRHE